ncbi:MAG: hypothetical protein EPGJADBJ_00855 [Saprospiraceae bacterium]|nr:hypothetical protein [Saprospiraceae bacterium]
MGELFISLFLRLTGALLPVPTLRRHGQECNVLRLLFVIDYESSRENLVFSNGMDVVYTIRKRCDIYLECFS